MTDEKRESYLNVTLTPSERERVRIVAQGEMMTDSTWARRVVMAEVKRAEGGTKAARK